MNPTGVHVLMPVGWGELGVSLHWPRPSGRGTPAPSQEAVKSPLSPALQPPPISSCQKQLREGGNRDLCHVAPPQLPLMGSCGGEVDQTHSLGGSAHFHYLLTSTTSPLLPPFPSTTSCLFTAAALWLPWSELGWGGGTRAPPAPTCRPSPASHKTPEGVAKPGP